MKTISLILVLISFVISGNSYSQNGVAINESGVAPATSAILDVQSTQHGVLIPRMTLTQRNAIGSPATGLLIYQTDNTPGFYYYNGSTWGAIGGDNDWDINGNDISHYLGSVYTGTLRNTDTIFSRWGRFDDFSMIPGFGPEDTTVIIRSNTTKPVMLIDQSYSGGNGAHGLIVKSNDGDAIRAYSEGPLLSGNALYAKGQVFVDSSNLHLSKGDIRVDDGIITIDSAAIPASPLQGTIRYTGTDFLGYDGATWRSFTGGTAAWGVSGANVYRNTGAVGIGLVPSGAYTLDVEGSMRFSPPTAVRDFYISNVGTEPALIPELTNWGYIGSGTNRFFQGHYTNLSVYGTFTNTSDRRIKENIQPVSNALETILQLKGKTYDLRRDYMLGDIEKGSEKAEMLEAQRKDKIGFIAQEVEKVLPQLVHEDPNTGLKSVDYIGVVPILVESVKEQQAIITDLKKSNAELAERLKAIENMLLKQEK